MKVLVYTLPNCVQCDMTKKQFKAAGVVFEETNVKDLPEETLRHIREEYGFTQAPIVIADEQIWSGFKLERIKGVIAAVHAQEAVSA